MRFSGETPRQERSVLKVSLKPFQRLVGAAEIGGRASQGAKLLFVRKRHRRVNAKPTAWQRGTAQVGGSPFYASVILIQCPLFSLAQEAQEKSLAKKKRRRRCFAACARRPTLRALDWRSLFEKSDGKTFLALRLKPIDKSKFENRKQIAFGFLCVVIFQF